MKNHKNKWMKGLSKKLISDILRLEPKSVEFIIDRPKKIHCIIKTDEYYVVGTAICSTTEPFFSERKGKNKAAGLAVKAAVNKENSEPVRDTWNQFPDTWSKRQIRRVMSISFGTPYRSRFVLANQTSSG